MEPHTACGACRRHRFCMQKVPLFSALTPEELAPIAPLVRHRAYPKGSVLVEEGASSEQLTVLNEGSAKASRFTPDGREQILYVFSEGDFFGERGLFAPHAARYTVTALEPVKTCSFSKSAFEDMLRAHPQIAVRIIEELERRMVRAESALQSMDVRSVDARVAAMLLDLADKYGKPVPQGIRLRLPLSREGLANYLGVARETVSRKFGQLENKGILRTAGSRTLLLLDRAALETMAGGAD